LPFVAGSTVVPGTRLGFGTGPGPNHRAADVIASERLLCLAPLAPVTTDEGCKLLVSPPFVLGRERAEGEIEDRERLIRQVRPLVVPGLLVPTVGLQQGIVFPLGEVSVQAHFRSSGPLPPLPCGGFHAQVPLGKLGELFSPLLDRLTSTEAPPGDREVAPPRVDLERPAARHADLVPGSIGQRSASDDVKAGSAGGDLSPRAQEVHNGGSPLRHLAGLRVNGVIEIHANEPVAEREPKSVKLRIRGHGGHGRFVVCPCGGVRGLRLCEPVSPSSVWHLRCFAVARLIAPAKPAPLGK